MAAVLFLLAKEIDHDPRLLFKLADFDIDSINVPETEVFEKGGTQKLGLLQEHPVPLSLRKNETLKETADLSSSSSVNEVAHHPCELQSPLRFSLGESYLPLITNILPPEPNYSSSDFIIKLTEFYHKAVLFL